MKFDSVISIGGSCEVAQQIRTFRSIDTAGLFDWWITPFDGLIEVVENNFEGLVDEQDISVLGNRSVVSKQFGIVYHHDFRRDAQGNIVKEDISDRLVTLQQKYNALRNRFIASFSDNKNVLLVRAWLDRLHEKRHVAPSGLLEYDFPRMTATFRERFPRANVTMLYVNYAISHPMADGVIFDNVEDHGDITDWRGSTIGWQKLLARHIGD